MIEILKHDIMVRPASDGRHRDPDQDYGIRPIELRFIVSGKLGCAVFAVSTGWNLPGFGKHAPCGFGLDTHAYQGSGEQVACDFLEGGMCYHGIFSYRTGADLFVALAYQGDSAVWCELEMMYGELEEKEKQ